MACGCSDKLGALNTRVEIYRSTPTVDAQGGFDDNWTLYATRWATVEPAGGREFEDSAQTRGEARYRVAMRRDTTTAQVEPKDQLRWSDDGRTRTCEIESAVSDLAADARLFTCAETQLG